MLPSLSMICYTLCVDWRMVWLTEGTLALCCWLCQAGYVSSESLFLLGDKILSFETRLGSLYSRNMFNGSKDSLN